mmetsp:Transcript_19172/g.28711  ORF Transcript_19172/g.28711 Transcript_19172/m.28711 type:complete len:288 (+) Transcript_19172:105-968(+)
MVGYGTRNLLDLRVGSAHSIQVLFLLRTVDLSWFNDNSKEYIKQLIQILSKSILPVECKEEIENGNTKYSSNDNKNKKNSTTDREKRVATSSKKGIKRKRDTSKSASSVGAAKGDPKKAAKAKGATTRKGRNSAKKQNEQTDKNQKEKDITASRLSSSHFKSDNTFLFGSDIQILYKVEHIKTSHSAMLNYVISATGKEIMDKDSMPESSTRSKVSPDASSASKSDEQKSKVLSKFQYLKPLPKRIVLWCYPYDPDNPHELNINNVGHNFPLPEMIPISSLFREGEG